MSLDRDGGFEFLGAELFTFYGFLLQALEVLKLLRFLSSRSHATSTAHTCLFLCWLQKVVQSQELLRLFVWILLLLMMMRLWLQTGFNKRVVLHQGRFARWVGLRQWHRGAVVHLGATVAVLVKRDELAVHS